MKIRYGAGLLLASMLSLPVMIPATAYGEVYTITTNPSGDDGDSDTEEQNTYSRSDQAKDSLSGPGAQKAAVNLVSEAGKGPILHTVSLNENYHEEYDLYEESLADLFFLYSNVGNGSITNKSVYVDIPTNVTCVMEKDGTPMEYVSKQPVVAVGTYILRITAVYDRSVPLSEQEEYRATFRFRITDQAPKTTQEKSSGSVSLVERVNGAGQLEVYPAGAAEVNQKLQEGLDAVAQAREAADAAREVGELPSEGTGEALTEEAETESETKTESEAETGFESETELETESEPVQDDGLPKDTEPPKMEVNIRSGKATAAYLSDDIETVEVYRDGALLTKGSIYQFSKPGSYRIVATDRAGNQSEVSFTLKFTLNKYAIAAVLAIFGLVAAAVIFVMKVKKSANVR